MYADGGKSLFEFLDCKADFIEVDLDLVRLANTFNEPRNVQREYPANSELGTRIISLTIPAIWHWFANQNHFAGYP
jgi:hypothetical protein